MRRGIEENKKDKHSIIPKEERSEKKGISTAHAIPMKGIQRKRTTQRMAKQTFER